MEIKIITKLNAILKGWLEKIERCVIGYCSSSEGDFKRGGSEQAHQERHGTVRQAARWKADQEYECLAD